VGALNVIDDYILLHKAKNGDIYAFEDLISKYEKKVYNTVLRIIRDKEAAKDISQEVFIKVYKSLKNFNEKSKFSTWLYRIAVNTSIDELRKNKNRYNNISLDNPDPEHGNTRQAEFEISGSKDTPEEKLIKKEKIKELYKAINMLQEDQRILILLRDIQGLSYDEISDVTGIKIGTVKSKLNRARNALKELILQSELFSNNKV
jgi:RNA polymerase sigma-70 factor (ECF subfamily)